MGVGLGLDYRPCDGCARSRLGGDQEASGVLGE